MDDIDYAYQYAGKLRSTLYKNSHISDYSFSASSTSTKRFIIGYSGSSPVLILPDNTIGLSGMAIGPDITAIYSTYATSGASCMTFTIDPILDNAAGLKFISLPWTYVSLKANTFKGCPLLTSIHFLGPMARWKELSNDPAWATGSAVKSVICWDGTISL